MSATGRFGAAPSAARRGIRDYLFMRLRTGYDRSVAYVGSAVMDVFTYVDGVDPIPGLTRRFRTEPLPEGL
ncbi:hypothetical protein GCM10023194_68800 [Planotetraspora phitsanulokensis]|uniref:Uncharacterized protein n=1 Tax=Planotetraspora phitsanulokensis TaxID=575192 RepID=A0A8J3U7I2_9ACTN|nr:hypothetical protein Pph01_45600 [Planotetraspora phitsanulokensis]